MGGNAEMIPRSRQVTTISEQRLCQHRQVRIKRHSLSHSPLWKRSHHNALPMDEQ